MDEKKVSSAYLRYKGRKYPQIAFTFEDKTEKTWTVKVDLKTAKQLVLKIKREISMGEFDINDYLSVGTTSKGITLNDFYVRFLEYREKLVKIDQLSEATYQHDRFALNLLLDRINQYTTLRGLSKDDMINFLVLLKDRSKSPTQQCGVIDSRLKQGYLFWEITDSHSITKAFARTRKALGLDYFNVHSLRHSFATYCLKDNIRITTVKEFLGHTDIKTTMIYAKTDDELKAEDIKKHKPR